MVILCLRDRYHLPDVLRSIAAQRTSLALDFVHGAAVLLPAGAFPGPSKALQGAAA